MKNVDGIDTGAKINQVFDNYVESHLRKNKTTKDGE
jgi:hypothetical protein